MKCLILGVVNLLGDCHRDIQYWEHSINGTRGSVYLLNRDENSTYASTCVINIILPEHTPHRKSDAYFVTIKRLSFTTQHESHCTQYLQLGITGKRMCEHTANVTRQGTLDGNQLTLIVKTLDSTFNLEMLITGKELRSLAYLSVTKVISPLNV